MEVFAMGWTLLIGAFLFVLGIVLLLSVFGLPGNWLMLILVAVYHFVLPVPSTLGIGYWLIVLGIAILGEVLEFLLQVKQAKKYGSSNTGTVGGVRASARPGHKDSGQGGPGRHVRPLPWHGVQACLRCHHLGCHHALHLAGSGTSAL